MKIGPSYLLRMGPHHADETLAIQDVGGALHKSFQLVGEINDAVVEIRGSLDPAVVKGEREANWIKIVTLTAAEPYKHHTGFLRWIRADVVQQANGDRFGVTFMGEE